VVVLARGGGAREDLACFDDERVVRAIATCPIPVVTGIGHERDESLCDLVADYCAHTPTAAAERVVPDLMDLYDLHRDRVYYLQTSMQRRLEQERRRLEQMRRGVERLRPDRVLDKELERLGWVRRQLVRVMRSRLALEEQHCRLLREKATGLDPAEVLRRGYAVMRVGDGIVRSVGQVQVGDEVTVQVEDGVVRAKVL
jgi:exodeoxyribonuclease VII large subunit